jgi:hypothetical protein
MLRNKDFYANIDTITSSYNFIYDVLNVLSWQITKIMYIICTQLKSE